MDSGQHAVPRPQDRGIPAGSFPGHDQERAGLHSAFCSLLWKGRPGSFMRFLVGRYPIVLDRLVSPSATCGRSGRAKDGCTLASERASEVSRSALLGQVVDPPHSPFERYHLPAGKTSFHSSGSGRGSPYEQGQSIPTHSCRDRTIHHLSRNELSGGLPEGKHLAKSRRSHRSQSRA